MHRLTLLLVLAPLLVAACGDPAQPEPTAPNQDTPQATLEAVRTSSLAGEWDVLYRLHLPSERAQAETRWLEVRNDSTQHEIRERLARKAGLEVEQLAALTLPELFAKVRTKEVADSGPDHMDMVRHLEYLRLEPVEGEPDAAIAKFRFGTVELGAPMKQEGARWWLYKSLAAFVDG